MGFFLGGWAWLTLLLTLSNWFFVFCGVLVDDFVDVSGVIGGRVLPMPCY